MRPALPGAGPSLRFTIVNNGRDNHVEISQGEVIHLGRGSRSAVVVDHQSASSSHVELSVGPGPGGDSALVLRARDRSQNGTGIVDRALGGFAEADVRLLSKERPEELRDGSALLVPLRQRGVQGGAIQMDERNRFIVRIGKVL